MVGLIFFKIVHHCWWLLVHQEKNTWDICSKQATSAPLLLEFQTCKSSEGKIGGCIKVKIFLLWPLLLEILGNARNLFSPSVMPLLMPLNLLCPFQTGPGAVQLRANPEAACHVAALLLETCECRQTEKTVTLKIWYSSFHSEAESVSTMQFSFPCEITGHIPFSVVLCWKFPNGINNVS